VKGDRSLLHLGQTGHSSPTHCLPLHTTLNSTAHFNGSDGTAYIRLFFCRTQLHMNIGLTSKGLGLQRRCLCGIVTLQSYVYFHTLSLTPKAPSANVLGLDTE
jgi:hypothetical protein